jgi:multidrug resistance efflux pump
MSLADDLEDRLNAALRAADEAMLRAASTRAEARKNAKMLHDRRVEIRREIANARQSLQTARMLLGKM